MMVVRAMETIECDTRSDDDDDVDDDKYVGDRWNRQLFLDSRRRVCEEKRDAHVNTHGSRTRDTHTLTCVAMDHGDTRRHLYIFNSFLSDRLLG